MADVYTVFTTYEFPNSYAEDPREEVKPKYFRTNNEDWTEAMYFFRQNADLSIDSGTDNQLVLSVGMTNLVQDNHYVMVDNGEAGASKLVWFVPPAGISSDTITINNTYLAPDYTDVSDYDDDITDVSNFRIVVFGADNVRYMIDGAEQILNYFAGDIEFSSTDSDTLSTIITAIEDTLEAITDYTKSSHTAGTVIDDDEITNDNLEWDEIFVEEGFENIIKNGGFEDWNDGTYDADPDHWSSSIDTNSVISRDSNNEYSGDYCLKLDSKDNSDKVYQAIENYTEYQGKTVVAALRVKGTSGRNFEVKINDGVGSDTATITAATGSWQNVIVKRDVDASASKLELQFIRDDATDSVYYLDEACLYLGRLAKAYTPNQVDINASSDDRILKNLLINPNLEDWAIATDTPLGWEQYGLASVAHARGTDPRWGHYYWEIDVDSNNGVGIQNSIGDITPILSYVKGKTVTFSIYVRRYTSGHTMKFSYSLTDGVNTSTGEIPDLDEYDDWTRISLTLDVASGATELTFALYRDQVANSSQRLQVANACLNIGSSPLDDNLSGDCVWERSIWSAHQAGAITDGEIIEKTFRTPCSIYPVCMWGEAETASTKNWNVKLYDGSGDSGFYVQFSSDDADEYSDQALAAANTDVIASADKFYFYSVDPDPGGIGNAPQDVTITMLGYSLAL